MNLLFIRQPKLGIDLFNLIHTKRTLIIQLFKHVFIFSLVILRLFLNILNLVSFTKFLPVESGIEFHQSVRLELFVDELAQEDDVIFDQVEGEAVALLGAEVLVVLVELQGVLHQKVQLILLVLQQRLLLWVFLILGLDGAVCDAHVVLLVVIAFVFVVVVVAIHTHFLLLAL